MSAAIDMLWPGAGRDLSDDELLDALAVAAPTVRANFVASIDGAATRDGRSGGLSGAADKRHFELLRRVSDVVLVGAGTVRDEGYGPMLVDEASQLWRERHGMPRHPVFAIVSGHLDLDPTSPIFTEAPVRPIVITTTGTDTTAFAAVAYVVAGGDEHVDLAAALAALRAMGHVAGSGATRSGATAVRAGSETRPPLQLQLIEEGPYLRGPQLRLLPRTEVASARHLGPALDRVPPARGAGRRRADVSGENRKPRRHDLAAGGRHGVVEVVPRGRAR